MVDRHISVPGRFAGGDFSEWIQRFEICSAANEWDEDAMARKLPTLLEKEALICWLDIPAETKKIFKDVKRLLVEKLRLVDLLLSPNSKHGSYVLEKQHCCMCMN